MKSYRSCLFIINKFGWSRVQSKEHVLLSNDKIDQLSSRILNSNQLSRLSDDVLVREKCDGMEKYLFGGYQSYKSTYLCSYTIDVYNDVSSENSSTDSLSKKMNSTSKGEMNQAP